MRLLLFLAVLLLLHPSLFAQKREFRYLSDLFIEAIESKDTIITFSNLEISIANLPMDSTDREWRNGAFDPPIDYISIGQYLKKKLPYLQVDNDNRTVINKTIIFSNIIGKDLRFNQLALAGLSIIEAVRIEKLIIQDMELSSLIIDANELDTLFLNESVIEKSEIHTQRSLLVDYNRNQFLGVDPQLGHSNTFDSIERLFMNTNSSNNFWTEAIFNSEYPLAFFNNNTFKSTDFIINNCKDVTFDVNVILIDTASFDKMDSAQYKINNQLMHYEYSSLSLELQNVDALKFFMNRDSLISKKAETSFAPIRISGDINSFDIANSEFFNPIVLYQLKIQDLFSIRNTKFTGFKALGFYQSILPELYIEMNWNQLEGEKLFIVTDMEAEENPYGPWTMTGGLSYFGNSVNEMQFDDRFRELISRYSKFYYIYKQNADVAGFNAVFREIQSLYTRQYEFLAKENGGVRNHFRWRLNQLLEAYTDYGTDPSKALTISFYLILLFAIFYLFFPSEWDVDSKQNLISNLRSAINKQEKRTGNSLIKALYHLLLSLINALTLSLNSFVTLGFGAIPTTGAARYVCIIQGFIGWFLLSIFSVALINQVIF